MFYSTIESRLSFGVEKIVMLWKSEIGMRFYEIPSYAQLFRLENTIHFKIHGVQRSEIDLQT